jgi:hypothetical protein
MQEEFFIFKTVGGSYSGVKKDSIVRWLFNKDEDILAIWLTNDKEYRIQCKSDTIGVHQFMVAMGCSNYESE